MKNSVEFIFDPMPQPKHYASDYEIFMSTVRGLAYGSVAVLAIAGVAAYLVK